MKPELAKLEKLAKELERLAGRAVGKHYRACRMFDPYKPAAIHAGETAAYRDAAAKVRQAIKEMKDE